MKLKLSTLDLESFPRSLVASGDVEYGLVRIPSGQRVVILAPPNSTTLDAFEGECSELGDQVLMIGLPNSTNASALRDNLPYLRPQLLGLHTSVGMGDRLGIATPGHIRAMRATQRKISPIFAQQSIREMRRTGRTPQQVMDDATWGIFEEGWQEGIGADADHLKNEADIDSCLAAGFTLFTIDPGEYVNNNVEGTDLNQLREIVDNLPADLQPRTTGLYGKYFDFEGLSLVIGEASLLKAVVKYGRAVEHVAVLYKHLEQVAGQRPFELEVSMDETDLPTSHIEHLYIAIELQRAGVKWVSFAPRFIGRFEKGVDYIGDINTFEAELAGHAAIARQLGPYKLSLHSGSDKFSIYPAFVRQTQGFAHLKTAGTSYLEALRTIAAIDRDLFCEIYIFAREHYEQEKKSYHVSAQLDRAPAPTVITDWPGLLEQFDAREILHVTFGSVLTEQTVEGKLRFYDHIISLLRNHREAYFVNLENHFKRHLKPFVLSK
jgi:hypothetical protein